MKAKNGNSLSACVGAYVCTRARRLRKSSEKWRGRSEKESGLAKMSRGIFEKSPTFQIDKNKFSNLLGSVFGMMYFCLRKRSRRLR